MRFFASGMSRPDGEDREREPDRVGAELVDHLERVDHVPLRLRHLLPVLVAHEAVEVDLAERRRRR